MQNVNPVDVEQNSRLAEIERILREAQSWHHCLEESITDACVVYDIRGNVVRVNSQFERTFGWTTAEIRGRRIPYVPENQQQIARDAVERVLEGERLSLITTRCAKSGKLLHVSITGARYYDSDGNVAGITVLIRQVAPAHASVPVTAVEPRNSTDIWREIFSKHCEGIAVLDYRLDTIEMNGALADMLDCSPASLEHPGAWRNLPIFAGFRPGGILEQSIRNQGVLSHHEVEYQKNDGHRSYFSLSGTSMGTRPDGSRAVAVFVSDITDRKKSEDLAQQSNERLRASCSSLEEKLRKTEEDLLVTQANLDRAQYTAKKSRHSLKLIVQKFQEHKQDRRNEITRNLERTVFPLLEHLRTLTSSGAGSHLLETLCFTIQQITSDFGMEPSPQLDRLTPREIQICQMIQEGKTSREISLILGLAAETVVAHRKNIRKKFGIKNKKQNLARFIHDNADTSLRLKT
ncbi:MAG TPA: PAS domain S-box protein [Desulfomonilaceae bacterium]|nr:PAS domain S-box protein [Desulfomonilaceae bacterium]